MYIHENEFYLYLLKIIYLWKISKIKKREYRNEIGFGMDYKIGWIRKP
jgi:hypothetical protein